MNLWKEQYLVFFVDVYYNLGKQEKPIYKYMRKYVMCFQTKIYFTVKFKSKF